MIRIIGGQWRGRKLTVLDADQLRPTPDRIRETVFNWLQHDVPQARCLDLFAGSGALGFEALSRGAHFVTFCELNRKAAAQLKTQAAVFNTQQCEILSIDANKWLLTPPPKPYDIVFCDPPFRQDWAQTHLQCLVEHAFVHAHSVIYLETEHQANLVLPAGWVITKERVAGQVAYRLIQAEPV